MIENEATLRNMFWTGRQYSISVGYLSEVRPPLFTQVIVLSAICIEIYLKTSLSLQNKNYGSEHNLKKLFNKLNIDSQLEIEDQWSRVYSIEEELMMAKVVGKAPILSLRDALNEGAKAYYNFRYGFELSEKGYHLNRLIDVLEGYLFHQRPAWRDVFPATRAPRPAPQPTLEQMRDFPEIFGKDVTPE